MEYIVPPAFLFEYRLPLGRCAPPARRTAKRLLKLGEDARLFVPSELNETPVFAEVRAGWCESGLGFQFRVHGKTQPATGRMQNLQNSDAVLLWIDTRPSGSAHRATEYCHHFVVVPFDADDEGQPTVSIQPLVARQSRQNLSDSQKIEVRSQSFSDGYELQVWIPDSLLVGFKDVPDLGRIGFYCVVQDSELGEQPFCVSSEIPVGIDPSTWPQLELAS